MLVPSLRLFRTAKQGYVIGIYRGEENIGAAHRETLPELMEVCTQLADIHFRDGPEAAVTALEVCEERRVRGVPN